MIAMKNNVSLTNSSRGSQKRQLSHEEQYLLTLLVRMLDGKEAPSNEEIEKAGAWSTDLVEIRTAYEDDGAAGVERTLKAMSGTRKRLVNLLAIIEEDRQEREQQEADIRTTLDQRGKLVFRLMTEDDIDNLPDIEWLISGILQTATVSLVYGDSNVGKTFFALHTAQCVARGLQWYGRDIKAGPVLYIYAEGIRGLKPRSQAWRQHHNAGKTDNIHYIGFPVHLISERETLINTISSLEDQRGEKYVLVVVDTFSNCAGGISQNDQMEIAQVLATAQDIARDGAHVMVVHHTNKQGMANGSQAFKNHTDTWVELKKPEASGPIVIHCEKQRDSDYFKDFLVELEVIDLGINEKTYEPITSCVMVLSQAKLPIVERAEQERAAMLNLLREHITLSQRAWTDLCNKELGISRKPFEYHLDYLKSRKMVTWTPENPKPRQAINYKAALNADDIENLLSEEKSSDNGA